MIPVNYHNHTYLCEHASGTPEEYVEAAIKDNIKEFGFSDHAPLPAGLREGITMHPEDTENYISMIEKVKEKFKNQIDIKIGFEVDFPLYETFNQKYFSDKRIDYFIGSNHIMDGWMFDHPNYINKFTERPIDDIYSDYYNIIENLIDSKLFNIIGHIDLIKKFGFRPENDFSKRIESLAKRLSYNNVAVEINSSGLFKEVKEIYPSEEIVNILFQNNVPITVGSDSHSPEDVCRGYDKVYKMLKDAGYKKIAGFSKRKIHFISI